MAGGGGAWKVAYADFVTAMMALFMVLWISALLIGTFSVEMIMDGITTWLRAAHVI